MLLLPNNIYSCRNPVGDDLLFFTKPDIKLEYLRSKRLNLMLVQRLASFNVQIFSSARPVNFQCYFHYRALIDSINSSILKFWFYELSVFGLGYRVVVKNNYRTFRVNLGFSHSVVLQIHKTIYILKRKRKFLILGSNKEDLQNFLLLILRLKKLNNYKLKGLKLKGQLFKLKPGKRSR